MAVYNTASDAANTAVRAFLTEIGEYYYKRGFNTGSGTAKQIWHTIRDDVFQGRCAYCDKSDSKLQIEHLVMFNRIEYGLHHPGNIVPVCSICNSRTKTKEKVYSTWQQHLALVCERQGEKNKFEERRERIRQHIEEGDFKYPSLSEEENSALKIIASSLYDSVKAEFIKAVKLFEDLENAYVRK
jgi:hypothetical protein